MADLDTALRQRAHEMAQLKAREDAARHENALSKLAHEASRLEKLAANDEVRWFLETYLQPIVEQEHQAALDLTRTAGERDNSAHRYDVARCCYELLKTKTEKARAAAIAVTLSLEKRLDVPERAPNATHSTETYLLHPSTHLT